MAGSDPSDLMIGLIALHAHNEEVEREYDEVYATGSHADADADEEVGEGEGEGEGKVGAVRKVGEAGDGQGSLVTFVVSDRSTRAAAADKGKDDPQHLSGRDNEHDSEHGKTSPTDRPTKRSGLFGGFLARLMGVDDGAPEEVKPAVEEPEFLVRPGAKALYKRRPRTAQRPALTADGKARRERTLEEQRRQNQFAQLVLVDRRRKVAAETRPSSATGVDRHQTKKQILAMQTLHTDMELELLRELRGCIAAQGDFHLLQTTHEEEDEGEVRCGHGQTQTDTDRHRQTQTDTDRQRQTQTPCRATPPCVFFLSPHLFAIPLRYHHLTNLLSHLTSPHPFTPIPSHPITPTSPHLHPTTPTPRRTTDSTCWKRQDGNGPSTAPLLSPLSSPLSLPLPLPHPLRHRTLHPHPRHYPPRCPPKDRGQCRGQSREQSTTIPWTQ